MQLKTSNGRKIDPINIDCILRERIMGVKGTMVQLKNGEKVFLEHSEKEVLDEMNRGQNR